MLMIKNIKRVPICLILCCALLLGMSFSSYAQEYEAGEWGYYGATKELVYRGAQALILCTGVFISNRTLDQIYEYEFNNPMTYPTEPMDKERIVIDYELEAVAIGVGDPNDPIPAMRAARREGLGCIIMGVDQTFDDIDDLPIMDLPPLPGDPETIPWPDGDLVEEKPLPPEIDQAALEAAAEWAFNTPPQHVTTGLVMVYKGDIIYERYREGFNKDTLTRTWSTAKSINSTMLGIAMDQGLLELNMTMPWDWPPDKYEGVPDPRSQIRLRDLIHMSSGLDPVDDTNQPQYGSHLCYYGGMEVEYKARNRGLVAVPGTVYNYENYDTLLTTLALRKVLDDDQAFWSFARRNIFDKIGIRGARPGVDHFGNFIFSSQVYANARDIVRIGLLYMNNGMWNGEQVVSTEWVNWALSPSKNNDQYGGQIWLMPDEGRDGLPMDAFSTSGAQGNFCLVVPSYDLIVVRRGLDWRGGLGFKSMNRWDLLGQVLKALPELDYTPVKRPPADPNAPLHPSK